MKDTVIVFARVPRLGTVKRRLARGIGDRAALRFHSRTLDRLVRALARERRFRTCLATTPARAWMPLPTGLGMRIDQGHGDVGQRMHRAFARFGRRRVVLLGCDIPAAGAADVLAAFRALGSADAVFGPATDGGYWLVGMGPRRPAHPFACCRWSTPHALEDTLRNFRHRRVTTLRALSDVDTADDYRRLQAADE